MNFEAQIGIAFGCVIAFLFACILVYRCVPRPRWRRNEDTIDEMERGLSFSRVETLTSRPVVMNTPRTDQRSESSRSPTRPSAAYIGSGSSSAKCNPRSQAQPLRRLRALDEASGNPSMVQEPSRRGNGDVLRIPTLRPHSPLSLFAQGPGSNVDLENSHSHTDDHFIASQQSDFDTYSAALQDEQDAAGARRESGTHSFASDLEAAAGLAAMQMADAQDAADEARKTKWRSFISRP